MSEEMTPQQRYVKAAHAMQSGVAAKMALDPGETTPKHLRTGVNSAMAEHAGLAKLLIAKGIITEAEYFEAMASAMEDEAKLYEDELSRRTGSKVTLA
jgi:hypothetical protein